MPKDKKVLQHCHPLTNIKYFLSGLCLILGWKGGGSQRAGEWHSGPLWS